MVSNRRLRERHEVAIIRHRQPNLAPSVRLTSPQEPTPRISVCLGLWRTITARHQAQFGAYQWKCRVEIRLRNTCLVE